MTSLLVYAIVGLALLALGWLLYRRRPSEAAGDAIAFRWLRPIVRWTVGLCGGLGLGLFLSVALLGGLVGGIVQLLLCQAVMGLLCFFAAQMLLQKSFRVFRRSWKEALALVIALAAITLCIRQDFFDVQNRYPARPRWTPCRSSSTPVTAAAAKRTIPPCWSGRRHCTVPPWLRARI